jgi:hypothetical protein
LTLQWIMLYALFHNCFVCNSQVTLNTIVLQLPTVFSTVTCCTGL